MTIVVLVPINMNKLYYRPIVKAVFFFNKMYRKVSVHFVTRGSTFYYLSLSYCYDLNFMVHKEH